MLKSMLTRARAARATEVEEGGAAEAGFTLIELMVVLLIIAILLAIAIPTFLGVTGSASDRAAQSNLTNGLTEAKAIYQNSQAMPALASFNSSAPEFAWTNGACTGASNCISIWNLDLVSNGDAQGVILATYSTKTQSCWYAVDLESAPTVLVGDASGATSGPFEAAGITPTGATTAGAFYAKKANDTAPATHCKAQWAGTQAAFGWGQSYSSPGAAA
jgi:prepilin-type N-terminal cleavage/methylation domain-containing protein